MTRKIERSAKRAFALCVARLLRVEKMSADEFSRVPVARLLVIRQHNQMGDMLLAVPAFRGMRKRFPGARITLVAAPVNSRVMENNPYVDEVLTYEKRRGPLALPRFVRELRRRRFDAAIVLNTVSFSVTSMLLSVASGARVRVGSTSAPFGSDLTARVYHLELPLPTTEELARMHEGEHNLYPLAAIGVRERDLTSILVPTETERQAARQFIAAAFGEGAPFVLCHPGAGKKSNIWPPERFAELMRLLGERRGLAAAAVRGPMDRETMDAFLAAAARPPAVLSSPPVGFLGALMERAALVLCNDTGVMHIAGAVGARCLALFGPTEPSRWKPANESVVAVRGAGGDISSITVAEALDAALRLLG